MTVPYLVTKSPKSVGIAILLTFLFGPIGLFYASVVGGLIMTFTPILLFLLVMIGIFQDNVPLFSWSFGLLIVFGLTFWLINIIWAIIGVCSYNKEIEEEGKRLYALWNQHHELTPNQIVVNVQHQSTGVTHAAQKTGEMSGKPNLQDWLKSNPGKGVNDYFAKFGT